HYNLTLRTPVIADGFEPNDTLGTAAELGVWQGFQTASGFSIHPSDVDYLRFETLTTGGANDYAGISFSNAQGDIDLELLDADGGHLASSLGTGGSEQISLDGQPAGTYYMRVFGAGSATNRSYAVNIQFPSIPQDAFEPNDTIGSATDLGRNVGEQVLSDLTINDSSDVDWYKFTTAVDGE